MNNDHTKKLAHLIHGTFASAYAIGEKVSHTWLESVIDRTLTEVAEKAEATGYQKAFDTIPNPNYSQEYVDELVQKARDEERPKAYAQGYEDGYQRGQLAENEAEPFYSKDNDGVIHIIK